MCTGEQEALIPAPFVVALAQLCVMFHGTPVDSSDAWSHVLIAGFQGGVILVLLVWLTAKPPDRKVADLRAR